MTAKSGPIGRALADSLKNADIPARDAAGVALARRYAQLLDAARGRDDEPEVFDRLGPKFLAALTALGLTLAGRGAKGGVTAGGGTPGADVLDELRARRERRAG